MYIQCGNVTKARRPDKIVNKGERKYLIVDIAVPGESRTSDNKKKKKLEKYQDLKFEIKRIWNMRSVINCTYDCGSTQKYNEEI